MRETLDCGVLMVPPHHGWMLEWISRHAQALGRLRLYPVHFDEKTLSGSASLAIPPLLPAPPGAAPGMDVSAEVLARLAIPLRRYDVCVLPVTPATVAWTRTALACARTQLHTPLLALARGLKAAAVQDLLVLGLQDFALHRACADELRARLLRLAESMPRADPGAMTYTLQAPVALSINDTMVRYDVVHKGGERQAGERHEAYPAATVRGGRDGPDRPGHPNDPRPHADPGADSTYEDDPDAISFLDELASQRRSVDRSTPSRPGPRRAPGIAPDEPFRVAKSRVVGCFERDYVRTALSRHAGNVASAARASAKHRRAFWALMRKHAIDADPYRSHEGEEEEE
ncbi:hypothetical protein [Bordetella sp. LUAb4]|uniref:hypothetical protein n=1 Tax=Bordetella sp. LUAb4 TaxID=2843195 RepID=UPI001E5651F2|nr:hypothetical protein [Bordetella sp. LUAb4]